MLCCCDTDSVPIDISGENFKGEIEAVEERISTVEGEEKLAEGLY